MFIYEAVKGQGGRKKEEKGRLGGLHGRVKDWDMQGLFLLCVALFVTLGAEMQTWTPGASSPVPPPPLCQTAPPTRSLPLALFIAPESGAGSSPCQEAREEASM